MRTDAEMQELYRQARKVDIESVLEACDCHPNKEGYYKCLFHEEKTPSAKIYKNKLKCFGCGKVASNIDIIMLFKNCSSYEALQNLLYKDNNYNHIKETQEHLQQSEKKYIYEDGLNMSRALGKENTGYIKNYLDKRCILKTLDIADSLGIEIRHSYYKDTNHICYNFKDYNFIIQKALDKSRKPRNFGGNRPVYFCRNNSNIWYITEGIEDALTLIIYHSFNVVCLNSVANVNYFLSEIADKFDSKNLEFIVATDTDESGINALEDLDRNFRQKQIKYNLYDNFYKYAGKHKLKDINECFVCRKNKTE